MYCHTERSGQLAGKLRHTLSALILAVIVRDVHAAGVVKTSPDFFPIGVWSQPFGRFEKWKDRGINTLMKYEPYGGYDTIDEWTAAANKAGLYMIREPRPNIRRDLKEPRLLAWMHPDEPDLHDTPPSVLAKSYNAWKKADPRKPVLTNFSGGNLLTRKTSVDQYKQYLKSTDWISNDFYPVTGWNQPQWIDYSTPSSNRRTMGLAIKGFAGLSPKPQFAIIETSNQRLSWIKGSRSVTAAEFRGQVWDSIINGAKGIIYFPFAFNSFSFDATPPDVVGEMTKQNARIKSLARVLNSAANPTNPKLRVALSSPLLESTRRRYKGDDYLFVLNMSKKQLWNQPLNLPGLLKNVPIDVIGENRRETLEGAVIKDNFAPFEMHVYRLDYPASGAVAAARSASARAVPEPAGLMIVGLGIILLRRRR